MKPFAQPHPALSLHCARVSAALLCLLVLGFSGCAERRAKARVFPWGAAAGMHPAEPEMSASGDEVPPAEGSVEEAPSGIMAQISPPPSPLVIVRSVPARPRVPLGSPPPKETASEPDVPQIAPQLTPAESAAAQQQTNDSLGVAAKNLEASQGRRLNGTQLDLASKVRGFIGEAKGAAQIGDWTRARNAAKKAEVLSQELASSL